MDMKLKPVSRVQFAVIVSALAVIVTLAIGYALVVEGVM